MSSEPFAFPVGDRFKLPSALRWQDAIFVALVAAVAVFALLAARSNLVAERLQDRIGMQSISTLTAPGRTEYKIVLSCIPAPEASVCEAYTEFNYSVDDAAATNGAAVLIDQFNGDLELRVNGHFATETHNLTQMLRLLPQRPLLIDLPPDVLKVGANRIEFVLRSGSVLGGYLSRVVIGSRNLLSPDFENGMFWRFSMPTLFGGALLFIAVITGFLGVRHKSKTFLLCTVVCLSFSFSTLYDILPLTTPPEVLLCIRLLRIVSGTFIPAFLFSVSQESYPVSLRALAAFPLAYLLVFLLAGSHFEISVVTLIFWMFALSFMLHGLVLLAWRQLRLGWRHISAMPIIGAFGFIGGAGSFLQTLGFSVELGQIMRGYAPIVLAVSVSLHLVKQYSDKTVRLEHANIEMADEIARVTKSLQESYRLAENNRRTLLIQNERQRLMGDLHDGLAGNLITIQALAAQPDPASLPQIGELSRRALLDLRLVVESLDTFEGDMAVALAAFRERILPQYPQRKPLLHWDFERAPQIDGLTPETSLGIFRILQEAVANAVRHGHAQNVRVVARSLRGNPREALIFVIDDGQATRPVVPGFGMRNMRRRAASVGARVDFHFGARGTVVLLRLCERQDRRRRDA